VPKPYSEDLRRRVVHAVEQQPMSVEETGATFQVSSSFVEKLLRRWRAEQTVAPRPHAGGRPSPLAAEHAQVRAWIAEQPDRTLDEMVALLAAHQQVTTSRPAVSRLLAALGLPRKKSR
jgi:transposase